MAMGTGAGAGTGAGTGAGMSMGRRAKQSGSGTITPDSGRATFDTPIGRCGIAWRPWGITRFELPARGKPFRGATAGLPNDALGEERSPSEAPPWVRDAMA